MKSFKEHITESVKRALPSDGSATKLRNAIIKRFGGTALKNWDSNPYSDSQYFDVMKVDTKALVAAFKDEGWTEDNAMTINGARHFIKGESSVIVSKGKFIRVFGKKKAKRSTLPYYD